MSLRKTISELLFHESGEASQSMLFEAAFNALIVANIAIEIYYSYIGAETPELLRYFVLGSGIAFGVEMLCRLWACVELDDYRTGTLRRLLYMLSPLVILDLAAIFPIILSGGAINTSFFRIFRLFELGNYISARDVSPLTLVKKSITKRIPEIIIIVCILMTLIVFSAFLFNLVEGVGSTSGSSLYSALPSIELVVQMLAGSDALETATISDAGQIILNATQVMGLFLIGLPSAFVTGSFVAELQGTNELKRLRALEKTLIRAFEVINPIPIRKYCEEQGLTVRARERTLDDVRYRMGIAIEDVEKVAAAFRTIKLRAVKDPATGSKRVTLEHVVINRPYGVFEDRTVDRLILATQNAGEPGLNNFIDTLATNTSSSLIANQLFTSGAFRPELRQNFAKNSFYADFNALASIEMREFVGDVQAVLSQRPQTEIIYVTAMSARYPEQFWVSQLNFDRAKVEECAARYDDMLVKDWSEQDETVLAMVSRLEPKRILKIEVSTRILRAEDPRHYWENLVVVRDLMRSVLD